MLVRRILAGLVVMPVLAVLVACQPGPESPSGMPTSAAPTSPTSVAPTTPAPSTPSREELFRQAAEVYRQIRLAVDKLEAAGGAKELPASLKQYITGELEANIRATYTIDWPGDGIRRIGAAPILRWVRKGVARSNAVVSTQACVDGSAARIRQRDGRDSPGIIQIQTLHYAYFAGALKAFDSQGERVTKC